jgi:hypothetical protein
MKLIVSRGKVSITFECDGEIVPIKSNNDNSYVKGLFVVEETIKIIEFQSIMKKGDYCTLQTSTESVTGTYYAPSEVDGNPIIKILTLN